MEILTLGGYGAFVWPAYIFSFVCYFFLYIKTKKELNKLERIFIKDHKKLAVGQIQVAAQKRLSKEILSGNLTY
tara:strand:+ start:116 stop:337 length:222 start_codon:yes stop_codon:yes gene_type:complete